MRLPQTFRAGRGRSVSHPPLPSMAVASTVVVLNLDTTGGGRGEILAGEGFLPHSNLYVEQSTFPLLPLYKKNPGEGHDRDNFLTEKRGRCFGKRRGGSCENFVRSLNPLRGGREPPKFRPSPSLPQPNPNPPVALYLFQRPHTLDFSPSASLARYIVCALPVCMYGKYLGRNMLAARKFTTERGGSWKRRVETFPGPRGIEVSFTVLSSTYVPRSFFASLIHLAE